MVWGSVPSLGKSDKQPVALLPPHLNTTQLRGAPRHIEARPPHGVRNPRQRSLSLSRLRPRLCCLPLPLSWQDDGNRKEPVAVVLACRGGEEDAALLDQGLEEGGEGPPALGAVFVIFI